MNQGMKRLLLLESSVIGFLIGVIVAVYILFLDSVSAYISPILDFVSFRPLFANISASISGGGNALYTVEFIGMVVVYIVYTIIASLLIRTGGKARAITLAIIVLYVGAVAYQISTGSAPVNNLSVPVYPDSSIIHTTPQESLNSQHQQYFGNEVDGDLNGDGIADVAFIVTRSDPDRGTLYYLISSISTSTGHVGTNLLFLGDKVVPQVISILDGIIIVTYVDESNMKATSTKEFYAHVENGVLGQIPVGSTNNSSVKNATTTKNNVLYFGTASVEGDTSVFTPCGTNDALPIEVSTSTINSITPSKIHDLIVQVSAENNSVLPVFGVFVGNSMVKAGLTIASSTTSSSTVASSDVFSLQQIISILPKGVCQ